MLDWVLVGACGVALGYQLMAIAACLRHLMLRDPPSRQLPPVSILKPIRGRDPRFYEAIRSHAMQDYPTFEILFGVSDPHDTSIADIEQLQAEFPHLSIRLLRTSTKAPNGKVGTLIDLAREAEHAILLVNDSDIAVPACYLRQIVGPLAHPQVGVVTCLYRATADHVPGKWEALGIASDFAPSVLVAPLTGVKEFALGSTLLFRREDLDRIGGFDALAGYIADDYQLAKRITGLGRRVCLSRVVVETCLRGERWGDVWRHQLRWHRTIRVSRGAYAGLPVTHASLWSLVAIVAGHPGWAVCLLAVRIMMGLVAGWCVLGSRLVLGWWPLIPLRDLWGSAVWAAGLFGSTVEWRGERMRLSRDGRIEGPHP
jgi:ceramide glucosyltransferase